MSSKKTIEKDLGVKFELYQRLGVHEYYMFDPDHRVLRPPLQGYRLVNGRYEEIPMVADMLASDLGFRLRVEDKLLRLIDVRTGEPILFPSEEAEQEHERAEGTTRRRMTLDCQCRRGDSVCVVTDFLEDEPIWSWSEYQPTGCPCVQPLYP